MRLTRRGRRLLALLGVTAVLTAGGVAGAVALGQGGGGIALAGQDSVVVRPGDTLWTIAGRVAPDRAPWAVVVAIEELNHLHGPLLVPGQVLRLP